jgi:tellurite resistance protein
VFDEEEKRTFERIVTAACGGMVPQRLVADLVADLSDQLGEDGLEQRIKRLAEGVTKKEQATEVLRIAALIASVSDDVSAIEREVLERIATAFKLEGGAVDSALDDVNKSLAT